MKLIIDIDKQHFELLQMAVMNGMGDNAQKIIAQGTQLDKIRDEIEEGLTDYIIGEQDTPTAKKMFKVMDKAFEIIDKHTKEKQNDNRSTKTSAKEV